MLQSPIKSVHGTHKVTEVLPMAAIDDRECFNNVILFVIRIESGCGFVKQYISSHLYVYILAGIPYYNLNNKKSSQ